MGLIHDIRDDLFRLDLTNSSKSMNDDIRKISGVIQQNNLNLNDLFEIIEMSQWDAFCILIKEIGYPDNESAIPALFFLLMDTNWIGSKEALSILISFGKLPIIQQLEHFVKKAYDDEDYLWLAGIKKLVLKLDVKPTDFKNPNIFRYLLYSDY